jgi:diadenylate cyclase
MDMLSMLLNQFVSVGVIIIMIVFQPEVRRFLLLLGNTTLAPAIQSLHANVGSQRPSRAPAQGAARQGNMHGAIEKMQEKRCGALIVLASNSEMVESVVQTGVSLEATITQQLIESVFNKESPLHDGAMVISRNRVQAASCILPLSENPSIPQAAGLRHRAAVGITERMNVASFVVSEETGQISFSFEGKLRQNLTMVEVEKLLYKYYE